MPRSIKRGLPGLSIAPAPSPPLVNTLCKSVQKPSSETSKLPSSTFQGSRTMTLQWNLEWQRLYVEALLETDPVNMTGKVAAAEVAILSRVEVLCTSSDGQEEWQAMEDAIRGLLELKREMLRSQMGARPEKPELTRIRASAR